MLSDFERESLAGEGNVVLVQFRMPCLDDDRLRFSPPRGPTRSAPEAFGRRKVNETLAYQGQ
jgi:hypothetical protein